MILLFRGRGPLAAAIRWQTRGAYAHAAWMCDDGSVVESHGLSGVVHVPHPWVNNRGPVDVFSVRGLTRSQGAMIKNFLMLRLGAAYDWLGCARFLSHVNRNNESRWFCSELVAEACEMAGRPLHNAAACLLSPVTLSWSTQIDPVRMAADKEWWSERFAKK